MRFSSANELIKRIMERNSGRLVLKSTSQLRRLLIQPQHCELHKMLNNKSFGFEELEEYYFEKKVFMEMISENIQLSVHLFSPLYNDYPELEKLSIKYSKTWKFMYDVLFNQKDVPTKHGGLYRISLNGDNINSIRIRFIKLNDFIVKNNLRHRIDLQQFDNYFIRFYLTIYAVYSRVPEEKLEQEITNWLKKVIIKFE